MSSDVNNSEKVQKQRKELADKERECVAELGPPDPRIEEFYFDIDLADGTKLTTKVWRPRQKDAAGHPLILLFHGGGFATGSCEMCTRPGREFALEFNAVVVSSNYRLAPEYKFPQSLLDGIEIATYLSNNAEAALGADPANGFVVGGYSAGGQVAAIAVQELRFRDDVRHSITGAFLVISGFFVESTVPERYKGIWQARLNGDHGDDLTPEAIEEIIDNMEADVNSPLFSPTNSPRGLAGFPRTFVQVGSRDVLRDDGKVFARMLEEEGVETTFDVQEDIGHMAYIIFTDEEKESSKPLKGKAMRGMAWLLQQNVP